MHYYQFNIGDYTSHTRGLDLIEDLAYRRLIDEYYLAERPFSGCSTDVARLIGFAQHVDAVDYVLRRFFKQKGELWHHERIEKELLLFKNRKNQASEAGKRSAEARKNKGVLSERLTIIDQPFNDRSTTVQLTNNHKPLTNISTNSNELVERAKSAPSRKVNFYGVDPDLEESFREHRKLRKAVVTQKVIDSIKAKSELANMNLQDALQMMIDNGWTGFETAWALNAKRAPTSYKTQQEKVKQWADRLTGESHERIRDIVDM